MGQTWASAALAECAQWGREGARWGGGVSSPPPNQAPTQGLTLRLWPPWPGYTYSQTRISLPASQGPQDVTTGLGRLTADSSLWPTAQPLLGLGSWKPSEARTRRSRSDSTVLMCFLGALNGSPEVEISDKGDSHFRGSVVHAGSSGVAQQGQHPGRGCGSDSDSCCEQSQVRAAISSPPRQGPPPSPQGDIFPAEDHEG